VAYLYGEGEPGHVRWKIGVIQVDGGGSKKVLDLPPTAGYYRWTPDGRALAYVNTIDEVSNIWIQPLDGGPPKQLTDFKSEAIHHFAWSRDGKHLALVRVQGMNDVVLLTDFR